MTPTSYLGIGNLGSANSIDDLIQAAAGNPQPTSSGPGTFRKVLGGVLGGAANLFMPGMGSVISNAISGGAGAGAGGLGGALGGLGGGLNPATMLQIQIQMQQEEEAFNLASTVLKDRHDSAMTAIQNAKSS